jgi:hypothetical protein
MREDIGRPGQEEAPGVGQEARGGRAVTGEVILHRLDIIFALATGAIEVFIYL